MIKIHESDNVVVMVNGHKTAVCDIFEGDKIIKYGMPIGSATQNIFTQNAVFRHYHSFFFHMLVLFFITLCVVFKPYRPKKSDIIVTIGVFLPFVLVSTVVSKIVDIDYILIWSVFPNLPVPLLVIVYQMIPVVGTILGFALFRQHSA